ncbi:uncharacterized protein C8Q71DRAFT_721062 [Rhodofomes roseus]|uniref:Uncharacterized protein n=1 Tax=Rhodofomes roseus TaxID=34475 RepID=A0ABQ8KT86_9APHY|nr:uncharacterized protein C8Q71DRAFT_721062 [Rhodofomes roseus]KAH9842048.1 hypothetical protein C8Q71DRAFT_721062 [Rhodofomes roseus]
MLVSLPLPYRFSSAAASALLPQTPLFIRDPAGAKLRRIITWLSRSLFPLWTLDSCVGLGVRMGRHEAAPIPSQARLLLDQFPHVESDILLAIARHTLEPIELYKLDEQYRSASSANTPLPADLSDPLSTSNNGDHA